MSEDRCPTCGRGLVVIELGERTGVVLRSCGSCDVRLWERDGAPSDVASVLEGLLARQHEFPWRRVR